MIISSSFIGLALARGEAAREIPTPGGHFPHGLTTVETAARDPTGIVSQIIKNEIKRLEESPRKVSEAIRHFRCGQVATALL
jgi:hypothetical protein